MQLAKTCNLISQMGFIAKYYGVADLIDGEISEAMNEGEFTVSVSVDELQGAAGMQDSTEVPALLTGVSDWLLSYGYETDVGVNLDGTTEYLIISWRGVQ